MPSGFNWDLWLGPRESRPYHPEYAPYNWRGWWAFAAGVDGEVLGGGGNGILFVGEQGKIMAGGWDGTPRILPQTRMDSYQRPAKSLPRSKGHHRDWLNACKGGPPASANFEYGARLTEIVLLGNVALRTGKRIHWGPVGHEGNQRTRS